MYSENPTQADTIQLDEGSLQQSHFNPENPIIILAHGWNSNGAERTKMNEVEILNIFRVIFSRIEK